MKTIKEKLQLRLLLMQDLDELKHAFFICAEFEVKTETSVNSLYKENNFKPACLTKQLLNMFKLWCEQGITVSALSDNHNECIKSYIQIGDSVRFLSSLSKFAKIDFD